MRLGGGAGVGPSLRTDSAVRRVVVAHLVGAALLSVVVVGSAFVGPVSIDVWAALRAGADDPARVILLGARLPRVLLAALVGAALGVSGAGLQALLQNPLACPHVLGISGGAALFGIVATIVVPLLVGGAAAAGVPGAALVPLAALLGGLGTAFLVRRVAATGGRVLPHTLLLTGVVFNAFAAAAITFVNSLADFYEARTILTWVVGSLVVRGAAWTVALAGALIAGFVLLIASARDLNAMGLGDEGAVSLGIDVEAARRRVYGATALLVAAVVPVAGMVGFVGLIVPHVARIFVGSDQRIVLPASLWLGGAFLVLADTLARTVVAPNELPVGVVTALAGGPFFLHLLRRQLRESAA